MRKARLTALMAGLLSLIAWAAPAQAQTKLPWQWGPFGTPVPNTIPPVYRSTCPSTHMVIGGTCGIERGEAALQSFGINGNSWQCRWTQAAKVIDMRAQCYKRY